jgi:hypothetical protein
MIEIDEKDVQLLDTIGCEEPWHIIAASFYGDFPNPRELTERLILLRDSGLITIDPVATTDSLFTDAQKNGWHDSTVWPDEGPVWSLEVTEYGFTVLKEHGWSGMDKVRATMSPNMAFCRNCVPPCSTQSGKLSVI